MKARHDYLNMLADIRDYLREQHDELETARAFPRGAAPLPANIVKNFNDIAAFFGAEAGRFGKWCLPAEPKEGT